MIEFVNALVEFLSAGFNAFILICAVYYLLKFTLFILPNRVLRSINIRKHGWPPPYCDADGDLKAQE